MHFSNEIQIPTLYYWIECIYTVENTFETLGWVGHYSDGVKRWIWNRVTGELKSFVVKA